jgi:hypothetical protein
MLKSPAAVSASNRNVPAGCDVLSPLAPRLMDTPIGLFPLPPKSPGRV